MTDNPTDSVVTDAMVKAGCKAWRDGPDNVEKTVRLILEAAMSQASPPPLSAAGAAALLERDEIDDVIERLEMTDPEAASYLKATDQELTHQRKNNDYLLQQKDEAANEIERLREALTPSAETKAAYHGEFLFEIEDGVTNAGIERFRKVYVPWTTVKEIMAAIRNRADREALSIHEGKPE